MKFTGNIEEAILNWEKTLEVDPTYALSAFNLAVVLLEMGEKTRSLEYAEKYLSIKGSTLTLAERDEIEIIIEECKK